MELRTNNEHNQEVVYEISRIQSDDLETITVFFNQSVVIGESKIPISETGNRLDVDVSENPRLIQALVVVEEELFLKLQGQLGQPSSVIEQPNYLDFYDAILISNVKDFARQLAIENSDNNQFMMAYSEFSDAVGLCRTGKGNPLALQAASDILFKLLALPDDSPLIVEAKQIVEKFRIPITIYTPPLPEEQEQEQEPNA